MKDTKTPITVNAMKRLAEWQIRSDAAAKRGSHLDSDDPEPPSGFEIAQALERVANGMKSALNKVYGGYQDDPDGRPTRSIGSFDLSDLRAGLKAIAALDSLKGPSK